MTRQKMILAADALLTMDADNRVLRNGAVLVEDGVIAAVGTSAELGAANPGVETKILRNAVLLPGHAYSPQSAQRLGDTRANNVVFRPTSLEQWMMMFGH